MARSGCSGQRTSLPGWQSRIEGKQTAGCANMGRKRNPRWIENENRIREIRKLVEKLGKPPRKVTKRDFIENDLGSLINLYQGSPKRALMEAGYDPGPRKQPKGHWEDRGNRIQAIHEVMRITGKQSSDLRKMDFIGNGYGIVVRNRTMKELLDEAGLECERYQRPAGYWQDRENRIREVRALVEKLGKDPGNVTKQDMTSHGLSTLLSVHRGSMRAILREAGYNVHKKRPPKYWNSKDNRVRATRELVKSLSKKPEAIDREDFVKAGLHSLLLKYRDELAATYERGDIITFDQGYLLKYPTTVSRALAEAGIIR